MGGIYTVKGSSLTAVLEQENEKGEEPTIFKLKGRLTRQGLKIRPCSSYSNKESQELYLFHKVKLK